MIAKIMTSHVHKQKIYMFYIQRNEIQENIY